MGAEHPQVGNGEQLRKGLNIGARDISAQVLRIGTNGIQDRRGQRVSSLIWAALKYSYKIVTVAP